MPRPAGVPASELGLLAPLLATAAMEARLYLRHEQQRCQAGLPPERAGSRGCTAASRQRTTSTGGKRRG